MYKYSKWIGYGKSIYKTYSGYIIPGENYIEGILRIYNDEICITLDDYNNGAYYEPSYVIARAYKNGEF